MAGRARQSRGKYSPHNKKKKGRRSQPKNTVPRWQSVGQAGEVTAPAGVVTPLSHASSAVPTAVKCPNLLSELQRVGILAAIVLVILLVLALVL